jgi:hypothetical protein
VIIPHGAHVNFIDEVIYSVLIFFLSRLRQLGIQRRGRGAVVTEQFTGCADPCHVQGCECRSCGVNCEWIFACEYWLLPRRVSWPVVRHLYPSENRIGSVWLLAREDPFLVAMGCPESSQYAIGVVEQYHKEIFAALAFTNVHTFGRTINFAHLNMKCFRQAYTQGISGA